LCFPHGGHKYSPLHEGSECSGGTKYVLRSDIMFKRRDGNKKVLLVFCFFLDCLRSVSVNF